MQTMQIEGQSAYPYPTTATPQRPPRTWPAALTLFILAPMVAEMLSGSTPPLAFINPFSLILETGLYGSGALVVRDIVRRRGLGWPSILALGAAYGILEEGLTLTTWFNPYWGDLQSLGIYGRALDTNWIWAIALTMYHAIYSITIPIIFTESLFPRVAARPWLGRRMRWIVPTWLGVVSGFTLLVFGFYSFNKPQCTVTNGVKTCLPAYVHPPLMWFGAFALAVALVVLAVRLRPPAARPAAPSAKRAPGLWRLRLFGLVATIIFFILQWSTASLIPIAVITAILFFAAAALVGWLVARWSRRTGWGAEHRLALAVGGASFFLFLAPLLELHPPLGKPTAGMSIVALGWLLFYILLSRRLGRFTRRTAATPPPPAPMHAPLEVSAAAN